MDVLFISRAGFGIVLVFEIVEQKNEQGKFPNSHCFESNHLQLEQDEWYDHHLNCVWNDQQGHELVLATLLLLFRRSLLPLVLVLLVVHFVCLLYLGLHFVFVGAILCRTFRFLFTTNYFIVKL
uniref:Uncharacterized protein n=1 Tax=Cacopsylla melanoneura TaxID=428564 RepID=A0A8D8VYR2_9HEMI